VVGEIFFEEAAGEVLSAEAEGDGEAKHGGAEDDGEGGDDGLTREAEFFERHGDGKTPDNEAKAEAENARGAGMAGVDGSEQNGTREEVREEDAEKQNDDGDEDFGKEAEETRDLFLKPGDAQHAKTDKDEREPSDPEDGTAEKFGHRRKMRDTEYVRGSALIGDAIEAREQEYGADNIFEDPGNEETDEDHDEHDHEARKELDNHVAQPAEGLLQALNDSFSHDFTSTLAFHLSRKYCFWSSNSEQSISSAASSSAGEESACSTRKEWVMPR
jgi:hypothetical protein